MPQRNRKARTAGRRRSRADRLVTIVVILFLVLVIGGAIGLQLTAGPRAVPTPPVSAGPVATAIPSDSIQRIAVGEAKQLVDTGEAVLVDVRSAEAYEAEHAANAVLYPESEEASRFDQLPTDKILIFYCT